MLVSSQKGSGSAKRAWRGAKPSTIQIHMTRYPITTGMQTVTATGPVTGTLSTASLPNLSTIYIDVAGLTLGTTCRVSVEDSASGTFGDALPVKVWHFEGGENINGVTVT